MASSDTFVGPFVHKYFAGILSNDKDTLASYYGNQAVFTSRDEDAPADASVAFEYFRKFNGIFDINAYHCHQSDNISVIVLDGQYGDNSTSVLHTVALQKHEQGYVIVADAIREPDTPQQPTAFPNSEMWAANINQPTPDEGLVSTSAEVAATTAAAPSPTNRAAQRKNEREPRARAERGEKRPPRVVYHVYVGGLTSTVTEPEVKAIFQGVEVTGVHLQPNCALVALKGGAAAAPKAVEVAKKEINGRPIKVELRKRK